MVVYDVEFHPRWFHSSTCIAIAAPQGHPNMSDAPWEQGGHLRNHGGWGKISSRNHGDMVFFPWKICVFSRERLFFFPWKMGFFPMKDWFFLHVLGLSENRLNPYTQWFCWSLSLLNGYFIGGIPHFQTNPSLKPIHGLSGCLCLSKPCSWSSWASYDAVGQTFTGQFRELFHLFWRPSQCRPRDGLLEYVHIYIYIHINIYIYTSIYIYIYIHIHIYAQRLGSAQALQRRGFPFTNKWCCKLP